MIIMARRIATGLVAGMVILTSATLRAAEKNDSPAEVSLTEKLHLDDINGWMIIAGEGCRVNIGPVATPKTEGRGALRITLTIDEACATNFIGIETVWPTPPGLYAREKYLALDFFPTLPNLHYRYPSPGVLEVRLKGSASYKRAAFKRSGEKTWRTSYRSDEWFTTTVPLGGEVSVEAIRVVFSTSILPKNVPVTFVLDNLRFLDEPPPDPDPPVDTDLDRLYVRDIRVSLAVKEPPPAKQMESGEWISLAERADIRIPPGQELSIPFDGNKVSGRPPSALLFVDGCRLAGLSEDDAWGEYALNVSVNGKAVGQDEYLKGREWLSLRHPVQRPQVLPAYEPKTERWLVEKSEDRIPFPDKRLAPLVGEMRSKAWSDFRNDHRSKAFRVEGFLKDGRNVLRLRNESSAKTLVIEKLAVISSATEILLFTRDANDPIHPWTIPAWGEVSGEPRLQGTRDEFAVLGIGVLALVPEKAVSIEVSSLRSQEAEIGGDRIKLYAAQYARNVGLSARHQFAPPCLRGYVTERLVELKPHSFLPLPVHLCQAYWIEVHVPNDARAGAYTGALRVQPDGGSAYSIPLQLEVLPFDLAAPDNMKYGIWLMDPYDPTTPAGQRHITDVHDHGIDIVNIGLPITPKQTLLRREFQANIQALRELGLKGPFFAWTDIATTQIAAQIAAQTRPKPEVPVLGESSDALLGERATSNTPAQPAATPDAPTFAEHFEALIRESVAADTNGVVIYFPMDEPNSPEGIKKCAAHFEHIKKAGGRTFVTLVPTTQYEFGDLVDFPCVNAAALFPFYEALAKAPPENIALKWPVQSEIMAEPQTGLTGKWLLEHMKWYYCGPGESTCIIPMRFWTGITSWKMKELTGLLWWSHSHLACRNNDGTYDPRPGWEGFRQGVYDYRYLSTLLARLQPRIGRDKALAEVNSLLPLGRERMDPEDPFNLLTPPELAEFRDKIIRRILEEP